MQLLFDSKEISALAGRYDQGNRYEDTPLEKLRETIGHQQYLTKDQLILIADWKSPRIRHHINKNEDSLVVDVTKVSFSTENEAFKIEVLTLLKGVGWPVASVILHFFSQNPYPIIDFRALYSINCQHIKPEDYNFKFWEEYVRYFRKLLNQTGTDKRILDRALWQYSYENQKR